MPAGRLVVALRDIAADLAIMVHLGGQEPALHLQAALADFIANGHYAVHIRKARTIYRRRQERWSTPLNRNRGHVAPSPPPGE
jgi:GntR family transcriptional regulator/MocR family aminotransferase